MTDQEAGKPAGDTLANQQIQKAVAIQSLNRGMNWFFWIAGLSIVNSIIYVFGGNISFIVGLAITQFVDGIISVIGKEINPNAGTIFQVIGLGIDVLIAGLFVVFGILGRKRIKWVAIVGMVIYVFDGLLFLLVGDWLSLLFHIFALVGLWGGIQNMNKLEKMEQQALPIG